MAILSQSSSNWMLALKVMLISAGVLCMAVILKLYVPVVMEFASSEMPSIWSFVISCLRPPFLFIVINCIIITIVVSSKFQKKVIDESQKKVVQPLSINVSADYAVVYDGGVVKNASVEVRPEFAYGYDANVVNGSDFDVYEHVDAGVPEAKMTTTTTLALNATEETSGEDELTMSRSREYSFSPTEKPSVSVRFGHRKGMKWSPGGGRNLALGVSKPKRQETLESTWKTITEGRAMPLARHLTKSDTWDTHGRVGHLQVQEHNHRMTVSETFNDRTTTGTDNNSSPESGKLRREPSSQSGKLRKEASLSQEELNRRVEAFIEKMNEEMRLQRQESLNQYMEMMDRGAHH